MTMAPEEIKQHHDTCESAKAELKAKGFTGAWNDEPNRINWQHAGLDCMMVRHARSLHWCGYVGLKPGHPCFGKSYDSVQGGWTDTAAIVPDLRVHGGLTYADKCGGPVCHITDDPNDETWWLGFDCAHAGDVSPMHLQYDFRIGDPMGDTYKDVYYVTQWTERLAEQLAKVVN